MNSCSNQISSLSQKRIDSVRKILLILLCFAFLGQCCVSTDMSAIVASAIAASGAFITIDYAFRAEYVYNYPLSILVLIGFPISLLLSPLLFTLLEVKNISYNLSLPVATFLHIFLASLVALFAHYCYRRTKQSTYIRFNLNKLINRVRLFSPVSLKEAVLMSLLGLAATAAQSWFSGELVIIKSLQGFRFFSAIPCIYLIQSGELFDQSKQSSKRFSFSLILFVLYFISLGIISLGRNSRSSFLEPIAVLFLFLLTQWLYGRLRLRLSSIFSILLVILVAFPLFTDFATAMVMVRAQRESVQPIELLQLTLSKFEDRESIRTFRKNTLSPIQAGIWDENYLDNPIVARFAVVKYVDNSLEDALRLNDEDKRALRGFHFSRLIAILPQPILSVLPVDTNLKAEVASHGYGDMLHFLATKQRNILGGFRSSHFIGQGMGSIGLWYLIFFFVAMIIIYAFVDSHVIYTSSMNSEAVVPTFSIVAALHLYQWFTIATSTSLNAIVSFPLREFFEPILLFSLMRWLLNIKF